MRALIEKIGTKKLVLLGAVAVAAVVDQLAGTDLLNTLLPLLIGG